MDWPDVFDIVWSFHNVIFLESMNSPDDLAERTVSFFTVFGFCLIPTNTYYGIMITYMCLIFTNLFGGWVDSNTVSVSQIIP